MKKDFDRWNNHKKYIHLNKPNKLYHKQDIWWCSLGVNIGFEQDGKNKNGERPVLIIKGFSKQVCLAIPLTTSKKPNPFHIPIGIVGGRESVLIISQLRLIDTKRLINKICSIDNDLFETIRKAVRNLI